MKEKRPLPVDVEVSNLLTMSRLLTEGAIALYEDDVRSLHHLALQEQHLEAANGLDIIGSALYDLRSQIAELQMITLKQSLQIEEE
ncbi:MAG: hypothetical protein J6L74_03610 [Pseudomonas sp.]|nr:hypothetical protein [Pseudomonas sp.]